MNTSVCVLASVAIVLATTQVTFGQSSGLSNAAAQPSILSSKLGAVVDGKPLYTDQAGTALLGTDRPKCPDGRHLRFELGRWTIMTADDRPAPDISFEYVDLVCNGPSIVEHDAKWGFISVDGKLLADRYFDSADAFHGGIATIEDNGLWAVIGEEGSVLLGPLKLARGMWVSGTGEYSIEFEEGYKRLDRALVAKLAQNPGALKRRLPLPSSEGLAGQFDEKTRKWAQREISSSIRNSTRWAASTAALLGRPFPTAVNGA